MTRRTTDDVTVRRSGEPDESLPDYQLKGGRGRDVRSGVLIDYRNVPIPVILSPRRGLEPGIAGG